MFRRICRTVSKYMFIQITQIFRFKFLFIFNFTMNAIVLFTFNKIVPKYLLEVVYNLLHGMHKAVAYNLLISLLMWPKINTNSLLMLKNLVQNKFRLYRNTKLNIWVDRVKKTRWSTKNKIVDKIWKYRSKIKDDGVWIILCCCCCCCWVVWVS